jgi:hypothetical protein
MFKTKKNQLLQTSFFSIAKLTNSEFIISSTLSSTYYLVVRVLALSNITITSLDTFGYSGCSIFPGFGLVFFINNINIRIIHWLGSWR